ncbi:MAG TPA: iron-sulfur cluster assembly scaffold protein [Candidatus Pacearchaeota archaeon]|nr:iron-sulfur cluster assembly scaffold protein [Candidatus Pacearchaeota archaeon]
MEKGIPSDMYREHILELYKSPSNFGTLKNPSHESTEYNSVCGDEITIQLLIKNNVVKDIKFSGSGCVISTVSASLLTDKIKGMSPEDVKELSNKDILKLLKIKITPARIKCALLSLEAAKKALK